MIKISPSILDADFCNLEKDIKMLESAGADILHFDIMDGNFVPNITYGPIILSALRNKTKLPFSAHLMISHPENFIKDFINAGADIISVHYETTKHLHKIVWNIKSENKKVAIALNPATSISVLEYILQDIDIVVLMSVNPGFAGQKFIPVVLQKIKDLKKIITEKELKVEIEVDGGINKETSHQVISAGADILVTASYLFQNRSHIKKIIKELKSH